MTQTSTSPSVSGCTGATAPQSDPSFLSFWEFFQVFVDCQKLSLPLKRMHQEVCNTLQAVVLGEIQEYRYVVVNIMPRVGKTKIMEALDCWMLAYFPRSQIIKASYSFPLVERSVRYVRDVLAEEWYVSAFGDILGDVQQSHYFVTKQKGSLYGAGVGGTITGFGAGLKEPAGGYIALDDPANPSEALSKVEAENLRLWFENTLRSRRNSTEYTPIIVCAQRLAPEDLCGYLLEHYPDETLLIKYPALVDDESQFPETIATSELRSLRDGPGAFTFASQYQQEPVSFGGNLIKTEDFAYHDFDDLGSDVRWTSKIIVADTAMKAKQSNDFSVLQCWGRHNGKCYLIDQARGKWDAPALLNQTIMFHKKHHRSGSSVFRLLIEDKASGTGLIQQLTQAGIPTTPVQVTKDKVTRVQEVLPFISSHLVLLPKHAEKTWLPAFISECAAFRADGKQSKDDQVDTMSMALSNLSGKAVSVYDVMRREREARIASGFPTA